MKSFLVAIVLLWFPLLAQAQPVVITNSTPTHLAVELPATSPVEALVWISWTDPSTDGGALYFGQFLQPGEIKLWPISEPYRTGIRAVAINPACLVQSLTWDCTLFPNDPACVVP